MNTPNTNTSNPIIENRRCRVQTRKGKIYNATLEETRVVKEGETAFCRIEISPRQALHDFAKVLRIA